MVLLLSSQFIQKLVSSVHLNSKNASTQVSHFFLDIFLNLRLYLTELLGR